MVSLVGNYTITVVTVCAFKYEKLADFTQETFTMYNYMAHLTMGKATCLARLPPFPGQVLNQSRSVFIILSFNLVFQASQFHFTSVMT